MKKIKILKTFASSIYFLVVAALFIIGVVLTLSSLNIPGSFKLYTVQSGSMEPAIHTGSVVLVKSQPDYSQGDVVSYKQPSDRDNPSPRATTTHRIISVADGLFQTKGDANNTPDGTPVDKGLIVGRVVLTIPVIGYPISYARTQTGLIVIVIIPATIIIYSELLRIKNEIARIIASRHPPIHDQG